MKGHAHTPRTRAVSASSSSLLCRAKTCPTAQAHDPITSKGYQMQHRKTHPSSIRKKITARGNVLLQQRRSDSAALPHSPPHTSHPVSASANRDVISQRAPQTNKG
ncbi:uncharacterized protein UTRI_03093 [Ustilago trichophora]|uniref:Uncharacterized protein n=1 Tax=Ustilago trichophora TaxID=86804 RepID=A0A5C3E5M0_9BASI|nr:uncharacterized protein UTRI_03093 [Ustilago trichophora]